LQSSGEQQLLWKLTNLTISYSRLARLNLLSADFIEPKSMSDISQNLFIRYSLKLRIFTEATEHTWFKSDCVIRRDSRFITLSALIQALNRKSEIIPLRAWQSESPVNCFASRNRTLRLKTRFVKTVNIRREQQRRGDFIVPSADEINNHDVAFQRRAVHDSSMKAYIVVSFTDKPEDYPDRRSGLCRHTFRVCLPVSVFRRISTTLSILNLWVR